MNLVAGVDPGLNGAIALLNGGKVEHMFDMPTVTITVNGKKKRQLDLHAIARWIDLHGRDIAEAFVEQPSAMPGQGVSSMFKLGFNCGVAQMALASMFVPVRLVAPSAWKKRMGLTADKDAARLIASQRMPGSSHLWPLVKHDGRAEAALLALYGTERRSTGQ